MKTSILAIDPLKLDVEWVRQPSLYFKYANRLADARRSMDNAKNRIEVLSAELARKARKRPPSKGERVTEGMVNTFVVCSKEFQQAQQDLIDARHAVGVLEATITALEHKRSALTRLVDLQSMDYFSEPTRRRGSTNFNEALQKEAARRTMGKKR